MRATLSAEDLEAARTYHRRQEALRRESRERRRQACLASIRRAIADLAPAEPTVRAVYLFGSILRPGQFGERSDVDVAVDSEDAAAESRLWRALEDTLDMPVDLRSLTGTVARAVKQDGECVYARRSLRTRA